MPNIAIVTDSSACLPAEVAAAHGITVVPLTFLFDGEVYHDGSLPARDFYSLLRSSRKFPTTASPAPGAFLEAFRGAAARSDGLLCVTVPSTFSGTYSSALNARELARQELPGFPIRVMDSHCLTMCHGFAVLAAARAAEKGGGLDEAEAAVNAVAKSAYLIGALDTMRFLAKSGRVPIVLHWAASLLDIKPVLAARGEDVHPIARVRTMRRAVSRLAGEVERRLDGQRMPHVAVMHADAPAVAEELAAVLRDRLQPAELLTCEFTSVMGAHAGPGFIGVAFYSGEPSTASPLPAAVASVASVSLDAGGLEEDVALLESSLSDVPEAQSQPALIVVAGLPGTGKSHFSRALVSRYAAAHLNSDVLRRALFPRPTHGPEESARLFAAIHVLAERLLARGVPVVLDATSLKEAHRRPLYEIAERAVAALVVVQTTAPRAIVRERLGARAVAGGDSSDATLDVYDRMRREMEPIEWPHITVDTSCDIEAALDAVLREIAVADRV